MDITIDDTGLSKLLAEVQVVAGQSVAKSLHVAAGIMCRAFGQLTWPKTEGEGVGATRRDVRKPYATPSRIYDAIALHSSPGLAKAFWKALKNGKRAKAVKLLRAAKSVAYKDIPFGNFTKEPHVNNRDARGRVKLRMPVYGFFDSGVKALGKYVKKKEKLVGLTQAGWYKCLTLLGHRNRVTKSRFATAYQHVPEDTVMKPFPEWVKRNKKRASGEVVYNLTGPKMFITIHNRTPWAEEALHPGAKQFVEKAGRQRVINYLRSKLHFARNPRSRA